MCSEGAGGTFSLSSWFRKRWCEINDGWIITTFSLFKERAKWIGKLESIHWGESEAMNHSQ